MNQKPREIRIWWQGPGRAAAAAVLLAGTLLLTLLGALSYRRILAGRDRSAELRGSLSYLISQVKNHDTASGVELRDGGSVLVLKEQAGAECYELRIYVKDGFLVEEYTAADLALGSAQALRICPEERFEATFPAPGVLKLCLSRGSLLLSLRAAGGTP